MTLDSAGRILLGGHKGDLFVFETDWAVSRFTVGGDLDLSFGTNGTAVIDLGSGDEQLFEIAVDADDRVVAVGQTNLGNPELELLYATAVVRLTAEGALDSSFGTEGVAVTDLPLGVADGAFDVAIDPANRIVVAGRWANAEGERFGYLARVLGESDTDGIPDGVEDGGPNGGDGNGDGTPDSEQAEVASLPNSADGQYVTLASPDGTVLSEVAAIANPSPDDSPEGVEFPIGHFEFAVEGLAAGAATTVVIHLPQGTAVNTYYQYGPTPGNPTDHWYEFLYDGTTGAVIDNAAGTVTLHFVDGQRGDRDLTANGVILDPGAPAYLPPIEVQIDAKPGNEANRINLANQGVIPVAIYGNADFDVTSVDTSTIVFAGAGVYHFAFADINNDGFLDLVLHFRIQETNLSDVYRQLVEDDIDEDGVLDSNNQRAEVTLTGSTAGGREFVGNDSLDLSLSGRALRDLLAELAATGAI
jgi:uncharacterized delta-60 repeat protein